MEDKLSICILKDDSQFISDTNCYQFFKQFNIRASLKEYEIPSLSNLNYQLIEIAMRKLLTQIESDGVDLIMCSKIHFFPLLMHVRNIYKIKVSFFFVTHSIAGVYLNFWRLVSQTKTKSDLIMAHSTYAHDSLRKISSSYHNSVKSPYSVNLEEYKRFQKSFGVDLIYIGRIIREKNLHFLIKLMQELKKFDEKIKLYIVGPANGHLRTGLPSIYSRELVKGVEKEKLEETIMFTGYLEGEEKLRLLGNSAALLLPSTADCETFGYVLLESLACGVPIVCSRWNGFVDLVDDKLTGILVDVKKENGVWQPVLKNFVQAIVEVTERNSEMRANSLVKATQFSSSKIIDSLLLRWYQNNRTREDARPNHVVETNTFLDYSRSCCFADYQDFISNVVMYKDGWYLDECSMKSDNFIGSCCRSLCLTANSPH